MLMECDDIKYLLFLRLVVTLPDAPEQDVGGRRRGRGSGIHRSWCGFPCQAQSCRAVPCSAEEKKQTIS